MKIISTFLIFNYMTIDVAVYRRKKPTDSVFIRLNNLLFYLP